MLLQILELFSTFCNKILQPAKTWFVARQVLFPDGETGNIVSVRIANQMPPSFLHLWSQCFYISG